MSPEEYRRQEAKSLLETLYEGSVKNFLTTLYDGKELTKGKLTELRRWFAEKAGEKMANLFSNLLSMSIA